MGGGGLNDIIARSKGADIVRYKTGWGGNRYQKKGGQMVPCEQFDHKKGHEKKDGILQPGGRVDVLSFQKKMLEETAAMGKGEGFRSLKKKSMKKGRWRPRASAKEKPSREGRLKGASLRKLKGKKGRVRERFFLL